VRYSKSLGLSTELFSNGVLMSNNNAIVAAIAAAGVDEVQISLDGASAAVHDAIRGQGMFNRTARALCMLRDAGVKVRLAMVVMPQNYDDLLVNLVPLLRRLGDGFQVRLSLAVLQGRADRSMTFPSLEGEEKLRVLIKQVDGEGVRAPNPIVPNKRTITCGYAKELTVNSDGLVYGCGPQKFPIGDVRKESVLSIADRMSEKALKAEIDLVEGCRDCNIRYLCGGTCRLNNIERKGRAELSCCDQAEKDRKINLLFLRASDLVPLLAVPSAPTPISNEAKQQWASPGTSGVSSGFVPLSALT
jgi:radical SAM protein with 4Fe4S-binding SPASM domain